MRFNPDTHHRQSIRLPGFDYAAPGANFVTIVTQNRECLFGDVVDGVMVLNDVGQMIETWWNKIPERFSHVYLDTWEIMPNHIHGIIGITDVGAGLSRPDRITTITDQGAKTAPLHQNTLGQIIAFFKHQSTKHVAISMRIEYMKLWQRNYHEHIIRTDAELNRIRQYVADNPKNWETDEDNPQRRSTVV